MRMKEMTGSKILRAQSTVCIILIAVMLAVSFTNLYTIEVETPKVMRTAMDQIVDLLNDPAIAGGEEITLELPEKLNVNLFLFIRFGSRIDEVVNIYKGMMLLSKYQHATTTNEYYQAYNYLRSLAMNMKELIRSEEFVDALALACAIVSGYSQSTFTGVVLMTSVFMTVILPVYLLFMLLLSLILSRVFKKNTEKAYNASMRCFKCSSVFFILVMALGLFANNVKMSVGIIIGLCACGAGFIFSAVISRFKKHTEIGRHYMNSIQLASAFKAIAFCGFFFFVLRSGVVADYAAIVSRSAIGYIKAQTYGQEFLTQYIFMLLAAVGLISLVCALSVLPWTLFRMAGMLSKNKETAIFSTVASIFVVLVPLYISLDDWRLHVGSDAKIMLLLAGLCWIFAVLSEVWLAVWRKQIYSELRESEKYAVLRGLEDVETERFDDPED